jgi:hypothetical protein
MVESASLGFCSACGTAVTVPSKFCRECAASLSADHPQAPPRPVATNRGPPMTLLIALGVVLFYFMGSVRIVSGVPGLLVKRQYFGFSGLFGSVADCTSGPWIAVMATNGPLCRDLQAAGVLESDDMREARLQDDIRRQMDSISREIQRSMNR